MNKVQADAFLYFKDVFKKISENKMYKDLVTKTIEIHIESIKIVKNRFVCDRKFYDQLIEHIKQNHSQLFNRKKEVQLDNKMYKLFNALKRKRYIHKNSAYFPKSLMLFSINPNPFNILNTDFSRLDTYTKAIRDITDRKNEYITLETLYIYLRLFNKYLFSSKMLEKLTFDDVLIFSPNQSILVIYFNFLLDSTSSSYDLYKTVVLDTIASNMCHTLKEKFHNPNELVFDNIERYEQLLANYKETYLPLISMNIMKALNKTYNAFSQDTIHSTLNSKTVQTVPLSLTEINKLYPNVISQAKLQQENIYLKAAIKRAEDVKKIPSSFDDDNGFELYALISIENIMKYKDKKFPLKKITAAIKEIDNEIKYPSFKSHLYIYTYIRHLLEKLLADEIKLNTFKTYLYTLNKHLFLMVEDINNIQSYELQTIMERFENYDYKKNSINNINTILNSFFSYVQLKGFKIDISALLYPKSLVFKEELDSILNLLDFSNGLEYKNVTDKIRYIKIQNKAILLLAFYSGLRKNELRSRQLKDLYFIDNDIYLDVNADGMKNLSLSLKTSNAKRRVQLMIDNMEHLAIVKEWMDLRLKLKQKSKYLFLKIENKKIFSKVVEEKIFDSITAVIKQVTQRYTTFHSLRHSFATYRLKNILRKVNNNKAYDLLELSIEMGHQSPQMTANKYLHYNLLEIL